MNGNEWANKRMAELGIDKITNRNRQMMAWQFRTWREWLGDRKVTNLKRFKGGRWCALMPNGDVTSV